MVDSSHLCIQDVFQVLKYTSTQHSGANIYNNNNNNNNNSSNNNNINV